MRALALDDQLALDPVALSRSLAEAALAAGATLHTGVRATDVRALPTGRVDTDHGTIFGDTVVLATGTPITRRGLYDLKTRALRSWAIAFEMEGDAEAPGGMWSEVGTDGRSVVAAPSSFGRGVLLVTGARHPVGSAPSEVALAEGLAAWARRTLPVGAEIARWSGQDYQSHNLVPFVGGMPRGLGRLRFATGYAGWGLTNAPAAAMRLSDEIRGVSRSDRPQWMRTIGTRMTVPADLGRGIGEAARRVGVAAGAFAAAAPAPVKRPAEGAGLVSRQGLRTAAVSTIEGETRAVVAPAPLTWNDAERSWDSPVDGSRYARTGRGSRARHPRIWACAEVARGSARPRRDGTSLTNRLQADAESSASCRPDGRHLDDRPSQLFGRSALRARQRERAAETDHHDPAGSRQGRDALRRPGEPLAGGAGGQGPHAVAGERHDLERQAENEQLQPHRPRVRVDELRQHRDEERDRLRVGQSHDEP